MGDQNTVIMKRQEWRKVLCIGTWTHLLSDKKPLIVKAAKGKRTVTVTLDSFAQFEPDKEYDLDLVDCLFEVQELWDGTKTRTGPLESGFLMQGKVRLIYERTQHTHNGEVRKAKFSFTPSTPKLEGMMRVNPQWVEKNLQQMYQEVLDEHGASTRLSEYDKIRINAIAKVATQAVSQLGVLTAESAARWAASSGPLIS